MKKAINRTLPIGLALLLFLLLLPWSVLHVQGAETPNIGFTASAASLQEGETLTVTITNKAMTITSFAGGFAFDKELLEVTEIIPTVPAEVESRSVHSTIEEANNAGTVGLAFTSKEAKDTTYEAGTLMTVKLKAKKAGTSALRLYEDSDGANGYQSDSIEIKEIEITSSPISSLQVEPIEIIEGTCDYRNLWMNMANMNTKVTVIYNGQEYTGRFTEVSSKINEISGGKNYFNFKYDPSAADQWTVGHEYDITVEFMKKTTPTKVRIIPSPVSSIQIEKDPIEIIEGTCGREIRIPDATSDLRDLVYFHYDPVRDESVKATVIYDGKEYTGSLNQISEQIQNEAKHNDSLLFVSDQSYYNQWTVGNEYDAAISFLGKTVPVKVKIVSENEGLKGDVNGDGAVDAKDLTTLAKHVAKIALITDAGLLEAADVNSDGTVDAKDLTHLAKYVAKIIPEL